MATFEELINRTITRLSMVPGYGAQTYAEDQIAEMLYHKFVTVRDALWWDDLMAYDMITLDADGTPNENVVRALPAVPVGDEIVIHKYADVQHVWPAGDARPLKTIPRRRNPMLSVGEKMVGPSSAKVLKVYGARQGDTFVIRYRMYWPMFAAQDEVPMDDQVLILGACWDYLEDDGANPSQIEKFKNLYVQRYDQLCKAENDEAISIGAL